MDNGHTFWSDEETEEDEDVADFRPKRVLRSVNKFVRVINQLWVETDPQFQYEVILHNAEYPCRLEGLRWDFTITGNSVYDRDVEVRWGLVYTPQNVPVDVLSNIDDADFYKPAENLLAGGLKVLAPGQNEIDIVWTNANVGFIMQSALDGADTPYDVNLLTTSVPPYVIANNPVGPQNIIHFPNLTFDQQGFIYADPMTGTLYLSVFRSHPNPNCLQPRMIKLGKKSSPDQPV